MRTRTASLTAILTLASCSSYIDFTSDSGVPEPVVTGPTPGGDSGTSTDAGPSDSGPEEGDSGVQEQIDSGPPRDAGRPPFDAGQGMRTDAGRPFFDAGMIMGIMPPQTDAGNLIVLAQEQTPSALAVQGGTVYFVGAQAPNPGYVATVPVGGGTPVTLIGNQEGPAGIAVDSVNVYWVNAGNTGMGGQGSGSGSVVEMAFGSSTPVTLASGQAQPTGIAIDSANVYWTNSGTNETDGTVMSVPIAGGTPATLFTGQDTPSAIAVSSTFANVYWVNWGTTNQRGNAYNNDGAVLSGSVNGGTISTVASGQSQPDAIAVDGANVYWTTTGQFDPMGQGGPVPSTGSVAYAQLAGGIPITVSSTEDWPTAVVSDTSFVYWVDTGSTQNNGSVNGAPLLPGAAPQLLVYSGINSWGLAAEFTPVGPGPMIPPVTTQLFWTDEGTQGVSGSIDEFTTN